MKAYTAAKIVAHFGGQFIGMASSLTCDDAGSPRGDTAPTTSFRLRAPQVTKGERYPGEGNRLARRTAAAKNRNGEGK